MFRKAADGVVHENFWTRVILMSLILFFVYLGDGILSDWVPSYMQESLRSPFWMGVVMSFSSMVGFGADLIFPQLLKAVKTRKLLLLSIASSLIFSGILMWTTVWPWIVLFLLAMAVWGIYYEFLGFGGQQFVSEAVPAHSRSGTWAILGVFKSLAYFLGPIIGSLVALNLGNAQAILAAIFFVLVGYLIWAVMGNRYKEKVEVESSDKVNVLSEAKHWKVLSVHVWPILTISLFMGLIDATFWTTGTVLSDNLASEHWLGGMFLPFYMLPMVIFGIVVARWGIYKGKKKIAELTLLLSGLFLSFLAATDSVYAMLAVSLLTGTALSIAWPLADAVYTDIIDRMGIEGKHMVGLSSSTLSLAYIIGPVIAGAIAQTVGEKMTFSVMGMLTVAVAVFLLFTTPKKLRLPQEEIKTWG